MNWRTLFIILAFPPFAAAQQPTASVGGQVTSVAGEALSNVTLRLQGNPPKAVPYTVTTDAAGNFVFENLEPGRYVLSAERIGYAPFRPGRVVALSAGQVLREVAIQLTPHGVIAGKVTDADTAPIDKARIAAYRRVYVAGRWQLQFVQEAITGTDGTFQVGGLAAGRYYVSAEDTGPEERNVITYFPSTVDPSTAVPVDISAGAEARVDIRMRKEDVHRIRGKVVGPVTGASAAGIALGLAPAVSGPVRLAAPRIAMVRGDEGSFEFNRVLPGSYVISTQGSVQGPEPPLVAWQIVNVSDVDVDDVTLRLGTPAELTGTVRIEGADTGTAVPQVIVGLLADDGLVRNNTAAVRTNSDGTFQIHKVWPNRYQLNVGSLPAGTYLKTIRFGSEDITRTVLDLTSGSGGALEIVLSPEAARVTGIVKNENGDAAAGVAVTVWQPGGMARTVMASRTGGFGFQNLPPGEYRAAAWEQIDPSMANIPDFLSKFESQAAAVKLDARGHDNIELKVVSREAIETEAAKLR